MLEFYVLSNENRCDWNVYMPENTSFHILPPLKQFNVFKKETNPLDSVFFFK